MSILILRMISDIEFEFAEKLNSDESVKLFIKLPDWFLIDTPLGNYNPDWAVLVEREGIEKLYFVLETKGNLSEEFSRIIEDFKISCGRKHFAALGTSFHRKHGC